MEVLLLESSGLPDGCLLSVRAGTTRRQAPADPDKLRLAFPKDVRHADPFKVDLLAPLGGAVLNLGNVAGIYDIRLSNGRDDSMRVVLDVHNTGKDGSALPGSTSSGPAKVVHATAAPGTAFAAPQGAAEVFPLGLKGASESPGSDKGRRHRTAVSARRYLDEHKLLSWAQILFQDLIRERPEDPWTYIDEHTTWARKLGQQEKAQPQNVDAAPHKKLNVMNADVTQLGKELVYRLKALEAEAVAQHAMACSNNEASAAESEADQILRITEGMANLSRELSRKLAAFEAKSDQSLYPLDVPQQQGEELPIRGNTPAEKSKKTAYVPISTDMGPEPASEALSAPVAASPMMQERPQSQPSHFPAPDSMRALARGVLVQASRDGRLGTALSRRPTSARRPSSAEGAPSSVGSVPETDMLPSAPPTGSSPRPCAEGPLAPQHEGPRSTAAESAEGATLDGPTQFPGHPAAEAVGPSQAAHGLRRVRLHAARQRRSVRRLRLWARPPN